MAAEEQDNDSSSEGEAPPAGKKKLIIIIVVALIAVGISVAATLFFLGGGEDDAEESTTQPETKEAAKGPAVYLEMNPPFQVGYDIGGRQRFMQVFITAQARSQEPLTAMEFHMPVIRSRLLGAFSGLDFADLQTEEGKVALREKTLNVINEVLEQEKAPKIEQVFFTNFVLQ